MNSPKNNHERYVITGVGAKAPQINNARELRELLLSQKNILRQHQNEHFGKYLAAPYIIDEKVDNLKKRESKRHYLSRVAVTEAIHDAGYKFEDLNDDEDLLIINGTDGDDRELMVESVKVILRSDNIVKDMPENCLFDSLSNGASGYIGALLKNPGPSFMVSGACASGNLAIEQAILNMKNQDITKAIVMSVSTEAENEVSLWSFKALRALNPAQKPEDYVGPLDENRMGPVLSDGAAAIIIERLDKALERGATILAEVGQAASINYPQSPILCPPESTERAVRKCLTREGIKPHDIDWVNLHVTGTFYGDINEIQGMKNVFGDDHKTLFNASKGHLGHLLAACGLFEIIGNIPSFQDNTIHPCVGIKALDPECSIKGLVRNSQRVDSSLKYFLNINIGMRGSCSTLILKRWER